MTCQNLKIPSDQRALDVLKSLMIFGLFAHDWRTNDSLKLFDAVFVFNEKRG